VVIKPYRLSWPLDGGVGGIAVIFGTGSVATWSIAPSLSRSISARGWERLTVLRASSNVPSRHMGWTGSTSSGCHPGTVTTDLSKPFRSGEAYAGLFSPDDAAANLLKVPSLATVEQSG
jgi:hypothetical protein